MTKETIVVWFSCGAASAVAAKKTIEIYAGEYNIRIVNNPIVEEDEDNRRFLKDVERWLGQDIEICINPKFPNHSAVEVWDKKKFMSSPYGAPCTLELKKKARIYWENNNNFSFLVMGFTKEEYHRYKRFKLTEKDNLIAPLVDLGLSKSDCFSIISNAGIRLPISYERGLPNANCIGCVKSSSVKYWQTIRDKFPEIFRSRLEQSERIGAKLIKIGEERHFLSALPKSPAQEELNYETEIECGIFCEEKP